MITSYTRALTIIKLILLIGLSGVSFQASAWGSGGHRVLALIAYEHLQPTVKRRVDALTALLDPGYPAKQRFLYDAVWPDIIRAHDVSAFDSWHFIDQPYSMGNVTSPRQVDRHNIVWALGKARTVLSSSRAKPIEKAVALRFLVHLVGDAHQPLHCIARYSRVWPQGDAGGNKLLIRAPHATNLHQYWDQGLGMFLRKHGRAIRFRQVVSWANKLQARYPEQRFAPRVRQLNPSVWVKRSYHLAVKVAYPGVKLQGRPSVKYRQRARRVVGQQIALGGYHLAAILNKLLS